MGSDQARTGTLRVQETLKADLGSMGLDPAQSKP